jgi:hypothetical protein
LKVGYLGKIFAKMEFQTYWRFSTIHSTNSTSKTPPAFKKDARECKRLQHTWSAEQPSTQGSGRKQIIKGLYNSTPLTLGEGGSLENIREPSTSSFETGPFLGKG